MTSESSGVRQVMPFGNREWRMKLKLALIAAAVACMSLLATAKAGTLIDPSKGLTLRNDFVEFRFAPGTMGLVSMTDLKTGYEHVKITKGKPLLWQIVFGKGLQRGSMTNNHGPCTRASLEKLPDGAQRVVLEWNHMQWWKERNAVSVKVIIDLPANSGIARWRIYVTNKSDYWGLWNVDFPKINGFPAQGEYDIARPAFATGGLLIKKCRENVQGTFHGRYPSGGWAMQFMAFTRATNSVYLATLDPYGMAKDFQADGAAGELAVVNYPENMDIAGSDWPGYYATDFGVYQGNWLQAALRYREWATRQKWATPLSERHDIPASLKDLGLWVRDFWVWDSTHGTPQEMNAPLVRAQKEMGVPMGIHWYFWNEHKFDNLYPEFFPPKPKFAARVRDLVGKGFLVMPYINGRSADMNLPDWKRYAPHATYDEAGGFIMDTTGLSGRLVEMCPSQKFWDDKVVSQVDSLVNRYECNGVYVDQVSAMRDELCFNPHHGHPLGGGRWWTDGNRAMMTKIDRIARGKGHDVVITSEGADELFLNKVDANLFWLGPTDREIPLINVVYSGYTIFFGSPCDYEKSSDQLFNFAEGRAFLYGIQNGWMDLGLFKPKYAAKADFLRQCGEYRVAMKDFLLYGRLLGPVNPENNISTFSDTSFGRWKEKHSGTVPAAEASLWKSSDGNLAVLIANYVDKNVSFSFHIDPREFGIDSGKYEMFEITPHGKHLLRTASTTAKVAVDLLPASLKVIEIVPVSR